MDVFIKSFNRPYYLERCLRSIYWHVRGNFTITLLDDGTPSKYLNHIQKQFPAITIKRSPNWETKSSAIDKHLSNEQPFNIRTIPVSFWYDAIQTATDTFLLLEEDAWLTQPLDVDTCKQLMDENKIAILKLYWSGNPKIVEGPKQLLNPDVEQIIPQFNVAHQALAELLMEQPFLRRALIKLRIIKPDLFLPYYTLYTVSSAIFSKAFWLAVWKDADAGVNEHAQLLSALQWRRQHSTSMFAKSITQKANTSYITSSVNPFKTLPMDLMSLNYYLNEAWLAGKLNPMQHYPLDFSLSYLTPLVPQSMHDDWRRWIYSFKKQFTDQGCIIE